MDDVEDGHDGRVVQPAGGAGLAQDALLEVGALGEGDVLGEPHLLHRDGAADDPVLGAPHDAHAATAEFGVQDITFRDHALGSRCQTFGIDIVAHLWAPLGQVP